MFEEAGAAVQAFSSPSLLPLMLPVVLQLMLKFVGPLLCSFKLNIALIAEAVQSVVRAFLILAPRKCALIGQTFKMITVKLDY